ncbi:707_t:CDS:2 [Funneliformis caledonium]|uniref:707_t:CDS:1 n=1 Tax=Funneliformis caledonium TaxID=1117310 RepID=A0A9N9F6Z7_9GLOM|nr:707_t:CDS:2 [Funneliformis caledonium]
MQHAKIPKVIIIGAGPGGLSLYHALINNKEKKEFDVKIFERDSGPEDRWQGYHISLNAPGIVSLLNCIPSSIALNLPKAIPNPIPDVEFHGISISDENGSILFRPPLKQLKELFEIEKATDNIAIISYRDRLRDVLIEGVPVRWGKKCIGYEETKEGIWVKFEDGSREFCDILVGADGINSPVRKQKLPELQTFNYGVTTVNANIPVPKRLMDRLIKVNGNSLIQETLGLKGDWTFTLFRLIPIEQESDDTNKNDSDELHYRLTLAYMYPKRLDESDNVKVDDNDPASVIEHVKEIIRKLRPESEMTDVLLGLWDLAPKTDSEKENFPFKTYLPIQRREMRDIDPLSINTWTSNRVTLLGDAAHAMNPIFGLGTNNAFQDADILSQALLNGSSEDLIPCIQKYENEMRIRSSADVLKSRKAALRQSTPIGSTKVEDT